MLTPPFSFQIKVFVNVNTTDSPQHRYSTYLEESVAEFDSLEKATLELERRITEISRQGVWIKSEFSVVYIPPQAIQLIQGGVSSETVEPIPPADLRKMLTTTLLDELL